MQEFKIGTNEAGQRLDKFLHKYLKEAGNSFLYKMLRKKNITLNKKKADGKEILAVGDEIQFFFSDETFLKFRGIANLRKDTNKLRNSESLQGSNHRLRDGEIIANRIKDSRSSWDNLHQYMCAYKNLKGIEVIFENDHILLLNKPMGILSQKSAPVDLSINEWLIGYLLDTGKITEEQLETFKPSICNRLDRNTSGLIICGKSLQGSQQMNSLIKERKLRKFYRTFVKGTIKENAYIKGFLKKDETINKVFLKEYYDKKNDKEYTPVETAYRPIFSQNGTTYLEVELITGKTHQIRAHLASIGHPVLGDEKYGDRKWNQSLKNVKLPKWQLLHSYRIEFPVMDGEFAELSNCKFVAKEPEIYEILKNKLDNEI